ncbi:MAG: hypothetical protein HUJ68_00940 [Clostridia bacterium]|nr:hypothetical protein [Clostridia bacterium]
MENASKALIIAGAILLSILLISLGIAIYTQAQSTVNNNSMSDAEISAFNERFTKYEGQAVSGTQVKALINEAISLNANAKNNEYITIKVGGTPVTNTNSNGATAESPTSGVLTNKSYTVVVKTYDKSGRISVIEVTEN